MRRALPLVLLLSAAACGTEPAPLYVTVTAAPSTFKAGEAVIVRTAITNVGAGDVVYTYGACDFHFAVVNRVGTRLRVDEGPCIGLLLTRTLAPGDSAVFAQEWDGTNRADRSRLSPGSYKLVPRPRADARGRGVAIRILD